MKKGTPHKLDVPAPKPTLTPTEERLLIRSLERRQTKPEQREQRRLFALALRDTALELRSEILTCARILAPRARREARQGKTRLLRILQRIYRSCRD